MIVCAALLAVAINSVGGHHRDLITIFGPLIGAAFIGTGLLAWMRRPENRFGALMVALGFCYCLSALIVTTESWTFIAGLLVIALPYAILAHILLAFPSGHLETRGSRGLAAVIYLVATVGWWTCMLFQDSTRLGLPANPLIIADEPELFSTLARTRLAVVAVLLAILGAVLVRRWVGSTSTQRRAFTPVYACGGLVLALYGVWAVLGVAQTAPEVQETLEYARVISLAVVPFAFLAGLLRSRVAAAMAVSELVAQLGAGRRHTALRDLLADTLGDPALELAYWLPERRAWVGPDGAPLAMPAVDRHRTYTPVELDGEPVAMLIHTASVDEDGDLVRAVGGAAALALENEQLDAQLRASVQELRASRARLVESTDAARRRIERDLHDGAQQQLVALAVALRRARARVDRDPEAAGVLLDAAMVDLDRAMRELRELARGIHPAILSDHGLGAALPALAQRLPLPVELSVADGRLPAPLEVAVYFVVAEALTNVTRYARASHARVVVATEADTVDVRITDDGIGGADPAKGSGLRGLADRVAVLDGSLEIDSGPGRGTTVRARIPVAPGNRVEVRQPAPASAAPAG